MYKCQLCNGPDGVTWMFPYDLRLCGLCYYRCLGLPFRDIEKKVLAKQKEISVTI